MDVYEFGDNGLVKLGDVESLLNEMEEGFKRVTKEIVIDSMCMHPAVGSLEDDDGLESIDDMPQCETEVDFSVLVGHVGTIGRLCSDAWSILRRANHKRLSNLHKRTMPIKPPRHLTTGKHGYRIRKWVK